MASVEDAGLAAQLDQAVQVRAGEELNLERLAIYLQQHAALQGEVQVGQFPSGFSNLTYLVRVGSQELVLRRPPFGTKIKSAHDMGREYHILSHLHPVYPKVPRPVLFCEDEAILGAPFYVMERVRGVILRPTMPPEMVPAPALMRQIAQAFIDNLVDLHAVDVAAAGLQQLGRPQGYIERQIKGWAKRYANARTDDIPEIERVATWLGMNMPPESDASLIHNDYKYNNLILDPHNWANIAAVLDWEMSTLADPLMDLGTTLAYWIEPADPPLMKALRYSPTWLSGNPSRRELAERYIRKSGRQPANLVFYYVYGLFKLAGIIQQIYARYRQGFTQDNRFAQLNEEVKLCGRIAVQAIERKRIDDLFV